MVYEGNISLNFLDRGLDDMEKTNKEKEQIAKEYYMEYLVITEPMFLKPRELKILNRVRLPYIVTKKENFEELSCEELKLLAVYIYSLSQNPNTH